MIVFPYFVFYMFTICALPYANDKINRQNIEALEKSIYFAVIFLAFWGWGLVGYDTAGYCAMYSNVPTLGTFHFSSYEREFLFWLWCSLCRTLSISYIDFRFISSLVDIVVLFVFFNRFLEKKLFPIAFVFYLLFGGMYYELEAIRNAKAISCFLISLVYFSKRKYVHFVFWNIVAFFFHITIVLLPLCVVIYPLLLHKRLNLILFLLGCCFVIRGVGLSFMLERFGSSIPGIGFLIVRYIKSSMNEAHGLTIGFLERVISFVVIYKFHDKLLRDHIFSKIFLAFFYVYIFFCFYFIDFTIVLERIAAMYKISYWILFPLLYRFLKKNQKYMFISILCMYGLLKIYQQYNLDVYAFQFELLQK